MSSSAVHKEEVRPISR